MSSVQDKDLTCRQWKLNPVGCLKGQVDCQYAHGDTGTMSPTSTITCWAWKHGGCKYHPDGCLFAHQDTGVLQTSAFSVRHRPIHGKDRAIAKAAAIAGFDCSDIDRLMTLVNAVRDADAGTKYPDYYFGESQQKSTFAGARYRQRKAGLRSYRDLDNPAVPAFTLTPGQILTGMRQFGPGGDFMGFMGTHVVETTNRQTINLYNKRTFGDKSWPVPAKKPKTSSSQQITTTNQVTIDLTQDDLPDDNLSTVPSSQAAVGTYIHPSRRGMVPGTSLTNQAIRAVQQTRRQLRADNCEKDMHTQTTNALNDISGILAAQMAQLGRARETLKNRWDQDRHLQLQTVTDDLADLNKCFGRMEDAGRDALDIIHGRLLM